MALQLRVDGVAPPDKGDAEIEVARGSEGAIDNQTRSEIAAHRVNCYPNHRVRRSAFGVLVLGSRSGFWVLELFGFRFWVRVLLWFNGWTTERQNSEREPEIWNPEPRTQNPERRTPNAERRTFRFYSSSTARA